ncbi:3-hydroxyanthranilate 3,4-dioxygenase-like [Pollicipes pollicipes]|uniref:3-hydroxyanthranilate 3,4-dioxygenase-like n=1 Tax=Pollicipes pollicipes TaxID=41117 RepID=UPI00188539A3|nr:3-hydroxyanthranilate 3,4-dioxygenase-like [Pollicipes pollicipes]
MATKTSTPQWLEENKSAFLPPVCNKMLHGDGQLKVFYVGGPNVRKDFHMEEGEEVFFQRQGDINLVTLQNGNFKDIKIREGEIFLLPGKIPHSPQRYENTVGLVIERDRVCGSEYDCLRYFAGDTTETLWERWFYCVDLGLELGPVIREFFASEECRTGQPGVGTFLCPQYFQPDDVRQTEEPFCLRRWLTSHRSELDSEGSRRLFDLSYQTDVVALGGGSWTGHNARAETFLWQVEGSAEVEVAGELHRLQQDSTLLVPAGTVHSSSRTEGCRHDQHRHGPSRQGAGVRPPGEAHLVLKPRSEPQPTVIVCVVRLSATV